MKADVIASQICCHHCTNTEYRQKCPRRVWGRPEIKTALPVLGAGGECPMMRFKEATREAGREYRCISKGASTATGEGLMARKNAGTVPRIF